LGVIPHLSGFKLDYPIKFEPLKNKVFADNIKKIIYKITNEKKNANAFVISSPLSSDGKTFIAILFALVAQELGKKVLLIDMDTEKTTLTKKFFNKNFDHQGFTNLRKINIL
jgi:Mrp family chromosome partitioning ATPase